LLFRRAAAMAKRELIEPKPGDKRYVRRDENGHFTEEQDDVGKSPIRDRRTHAKDEASHGDRGDQCADSQKLVDPHRNAGMKPWSFLHRVVKALPEKMRISTFDGVEKDAKPQKDQYLGKGSRVTGKLNLDETVQVDGSVQGDIFAETLILGEAAVVTGQISGHTVVIKGQVTGDINARTRVEICNSGKLHGNIVAPNLVIHEGGIFEGRCSRNAPLRTVSP
jgi:cytoskeletal protein CcmA (bactofilin family)